MKKMSQIFLILLGFAILATSAQSQIKPKMTQFEALMKRLSPYLMSEKEYSNPENYKKVEGILNEINVNLIELMKDPAVVGSNYKFRFQVLADGFKDVEQSYKNRFLDYSFWNLKSQLYQCSSCHTEKQMVDRWYTPELVNHTDLFAQADFQFMLRGYEGAVEKYQKLIQGYPKNKLSENNLDHAVKKIGYYYLRILQNDQKTLKALSDISQNKEMPTYLARHLQKWIEYFNVKKFRMLPEKAEDQSLKKLKEFIEDREVIADFYGSGDDRFPIDQETLIYLHRVMDLNQNKEISPWLYYWIGKLQNNYKESLFDNSGELYLKECFTAYPKSKVAKLCKAEHKAILDSRESK